MILGQTKRRHQASTQSQALGTESQNPKNSQTLKTQETTPPPKLGEGSHSMVDPLTVTPISTIEPGSGYLDYVVLLSEYMFDRSHLAVVKRTPKRRKILVGGLEKLVIEGFEESTIWNIAGQDVARVGVESLIVIVGMALADQTSTEAMAKEIAQLKQSMAQFQAKLAETVKNVAKEKQRSLDELKTALEVKHEQETQRLRELHAREKEEIQSEIETSIFDNKEAETLKVVKNYALVINTDLQMAQLDYLDQVERLSFYHDQEKTLLQNVAQQEEFHAQSKANLQSISCFQRVNVIPPSGIPKLGKDEIFKYNYTSETWKSEVENTKTAIERADELAEGVWNNYADAMEEWGIGEVEETLEAFTSKAKDVEKLRASSETKITDLSILDAESMEISMVEPAKLTTQIKEQARLAKKEIKEIVTLTIKGRYQVQYARGPETQELSELSDKWTRCEQASAKGSGPSTSVTEN